MHKYKYRVEHVMENGIGGRKVTDSKVVEISFSGDPHTDAGKGMPRAKREIKKAMGVSGVPGEWFHFGSHLHFYFRRGRHYLNVYNA